MTKPLPIVFFGDVWCPTCAHSNLAVMDGLGSELSQAMDPPAGFEIEGVMKEERCCIRTTLISRILYWHSMTSSPGFLGNSQETYNRSASIVLRMWASLTNPNIATWKVIAHFVTQGWLSPSIQTIISFGQVSTSFEMMLHYHCEL